MNIITVSGRLTRDPEVNTSEGGVKWARFAIADNQGKDKQGEEKVSFFECRAFKYGADIISDARKGDMVVCVGRIEQNVGKDDRRYWQLICAEVYRAQMARKAPRAAQDDETPPPPMDDTDNQDEPTESGLPF